MSPKCPNTINDPSHTFSFLKIQASFVAVVICFHISSYKGRKIMGKTYTNRHVTHMPSKQSEYYQATPHLHCSKLLQVLFSSTDEFRGLKAVSLSSMSLLSVPSDAKLSEHKQTSPEAQIEMRGNRSSPVSTHQQQYLQ